MKKKICIIIPAYNEAKVIGGVIRDIVQQLKTAEKSEYYFKVLVVDDGSSDDSAKIASDAGASVIQHVLNSGAGSATATGLRFALIHNYDIAATMDADGQHDIEDLLEGIAQIQKRNVDLLVGSRLINSAGMSRVKILGNRGLSLITEIVFGVRSTDSQSGLRIFSKKAISKLQWKSSGYEFCSEMLWRAKQQKLSFDEYPIRAIYTDYSKSKGQSNWNAINIVKNLTKSRLMEFFR